MLSEQMEYNYDSYVYIFMNLRFWVIRQEMCNSNFSISISITPSLLCFHLDLDLAPPEKRDLVNGQPLKLLLCQFSIIFYFYFYYFLLALSTIWSTLKAPPLLALYYSPAKHSLQPSQYNTNWTVSCSF